MDLYQLKTSPTKEVAAFFKITRLETPPPDYWRCAACWQIHSQFTIDTSGKMFPSGHHPYVTSTGELTAPQCEVERYHLQHKVLPNTHNLEKLALYLENLQPGQYADSPRAHKPCLDKHLRIMFGKIPKEGDHLKDILGIHYPSNEYAFLFQPSWQKVDGSPSGAAKRIRYLLAHGAPPYSFWQQAIEGIIPLFY